LDFCHEKWSSSASQPENGGITIDECGQAHASSSDATRPPAVGGDLLNALDAALVAAWEDDALIEAFCQDEGLVGAVADLEFAIEVVRSALARPRRERELSALCQSRER